MNYVSIPMKSQGHKQYHKAYEYDPKIRCVSFSYQNVLLRYTKYVRLAQASIIGSNLYYLCFVMWLRYQTILLGGYITHKALEDATRIRSAYPHITIYNIFGCRARTSHVVGAPQFAAWYIRSRFILSFYPTIDKEQRLGGEGEDKK